MDKTYCNPEGKTVNAYLMVMDDSWGDFFIVIYGESTPFFLDGFNLTLHPEPVWSTDGELTPEMNEKILETAQAAQYRLRHGIEVRPTTLAEVADETRKLLTA